MYVIKRRGRYLSLTPAPFHCWSSHQRDAIRFPGYEDARYLIGRAVPAGCRVVRLRHRRVKVKP